MLLLLRVVVCQSGPVSYACVLCARCVISCVVLPSPLHLICFVPVLFRRCVLHPASHRLARIVSYRVVLAVMCRRAVVVMLSVIW